VIHDDVDLSASKPSCLYWVKPQRNSVANRWEKQFTRGLLRPMRVDSLCAQLGTCLLAGVNLGIPISPDAWVCDKKLDALQFVVRNVPQVSHAWDSMAAYTRGSGFCVKSGTMRTSPTHSRPTRDLLIFGTPCQPVSKLRNHATDEPSKGCKAHHLYSATFGDNGSAQHVPGDSALEAVEANPPDAVLFENVDAFGGPDPKTGIIPLRTFLDRLRAIRTIAGDQKYTAIHVWKINSTLWIDMKRPRFRSRTYFIAIRIHI
jgi:site-specific DNA-cytosine methylase